MANATFVPDTTRYSPDNAKGFAAAAHLVYSNEATIEAAVRNWGFDNFRFIDQRNTQAFVAGNDKMIAVVFRGTEPDNIRDWADDARAIPVPGPAGLVHAGFKRAFDAAWPHIAAAIVDFQTDAQSIWFAGHSLGAALATLGAAYRTVAVDQTVNGIYTYGSPRIGNDDFVAKYNRIVGGRTFRFVNNNDIVTRVPFRSSLFGHVGSLRYFDKDGTLRTDPHWWNRFLDGVQGTFDDIIRKEAGWIDDHKMDRYIANLGKNATPVD